MASLDSPASQPLENQKWERFAQLVAEGRYAYEAYMAVYPESSQPAARSSACELMDKASVAERVHFLKGVTAVSAMLTKDETAMFLASVVRCRVNELPDNSELIQGVKRKDGEIIEVKVPDKLRALELNAKLAGWLDQKDTGAGVVNINLICQELPTVAGRTIDVEP